MWFSVPIAFLVVMAGCSQVDDVEQPTLEAPDVDLTSALMSEESPIGVWMVTWDRTSTGWKPAQFTGTLVVTENAMGLDWRQSSGEPILRELQIEGNELVIHYGWEGSDGSSVIKAEVEDGGLWGRMKTEGADGKGVPWSPLSGVRVSPAIDGRIAAKDEVPEE